MSIVSESTTLVGLLGVAGLGFVLGWTLYFSNRGKSGQISVTELASIAAVVLGGALTGFLKDSPDLLGAYGIGLAAGFLTLFTLTARTLAPSGARPGGLAGAIESVPSPGSGRTAEGVTSDGAAIGRADRRHATMLEALQASILEVVAVRREADGDARERLTEDLHRLLETQRRLTLSKAVAAMNSDDILVLLVVLDEEADTLKTVAGRMRDFTAAQANISETITAISGTVTSLQALIR